MLMLQTQINESSATLLEMEMVMLPSVDIVGTSMDLNTPLAGIFGTSMHLDPKDKKHIGGLATTTHSETNTKKVMDNVMMEKEDNDIGPVQEKSVEDGIDERKGIDLYLSPLGNQRLVEEVSRLKCSSFICRLLGGCLNKELLRDMLQATLLDIMPPI